MDTHPAIEAPNKYGLKVATDLSPFERELLNYLREKRIINSNVIELTLAERAVTGEKVTFILTRNGFINRKTLVAAILQINPAGIQGEQYYTTRIPAELLIRTKTMVAAETDKQIMVATLNPERQVRMELEPYVTGLEVVFMPLNHDQLEDYHSELERMTTDNGNLVERLVRRALTEGCSDVHILPRHGSFTVQYRHLGVLQIAYEGGLDEYMTVTARIKDLSRMDLAERRVPQDGAFQLEHDGKLIDLRVATIPTVNGEKIVIRILDPDRVEPTLEGLGITNLAEWRKGVSRPDGLCLICGPTGSGKTTTLNASIKEFDRFGKAVYSVEDPVEYRIALTGQVNTNASVGLDFARVIRAFMRADPDVIILGEVRDPDTARNAVKAAETGHLVLATLHTGSIPESIQRLRDLEVPAHELRHLIRSVLVQRLLRVYCLFCEGKGCPRCFNTGFGGRTVTSECSYFPDDKAVTKLLNGDVSWPIMVEDALLKVKQGLTSEEEVLRVFGASAVDAIEKSKS